MEQPDATAQDQPGLPDQPQIEEAARAWGVETEYWDIWGKQHRAWPELETAILKSMGVDLSSKASLHQAIERRQHRQWRSPLAPTIFLTAGQPHEVPVSLPSARADSAATFRILMEDGGRVELKIALGEILAGEAIELD